MKPFITADIHIGKNTVDEDELFAVLYYMLEQALANKCDSFQILGDLLEHRSLLSFRIWPRVKKFFDDLVDSGIPTVVISGNHDFYNTVHRTESNLRHVSINPKVRIIDTILVEDDIVYVPWLFTGETIPTGGKVIFAHLAFNGFKMQAKRIETEGLEIPVMDIPIYTGHFHISQVSGPVRYLGNPIHSTWNDCNETKCGYILGADYEVEKAITLNHLFTNLIKISYDELPNFKIENKCRITVTDVPIGDEELVSKALLKQGATSVECLNKMDDSIKKTIDDGMKRGLSVEEAVEEQMEKHELKAELLELHRIINR